VYFYDDELPAPCPNPEPEDCSLSVLDDSLFNTFAAKGIYRIMFHVTVYRQSSMHCLLVSRSVTKIIGLIIQIILNRYCHNFVQRNYLNRDPRFVTVCRTALKIPPEIPQLSDLLEFLSVFLRVSFTKKNLFVIMTYWKGI
jgi:hypothetical protein